MISKEMIRNLLSRYSNITYTEKWSKSTKSIYFEMKVWGGDDELIEEKVLRLSDHIDVYGKSDFSVNRFESNYGEFLVWLGKVGKKLKKYRDTYTVYDIREERELIESEMSKKRAMLLGLGYLCINNRTGENLMYEKK